VELTRCCRSGLPSWKGIDVCEGLGSVPSPDKTHLKRGGAPVRKKVAHIVKEGAISLLEAKKRSRRPAQMKLAGARTFQSAGPGQSAAEGGFAEQSLLGCRPIASREIPPPWDYFTDL